MAFKRHSRCSSAFHSFLMAASIQLFRNAAVNLLRVDWHGLGTGLGPPKGLFLDN